MSIPAPTRAGLLIALALVLGATSLGGASRAAGTSRVTQPVPPVSTGDFHIEPSGVVPADGDGLIPNEVTPTGSAPGPVSHCDHTIDSATGASAATVNSLIAAKENSITSRYVLCLAGTFTAPIHVWSKWSEALLVIEAEPGKSAALALGEVKGSQVNPNDHDGGDTGGVDITDSRGVEVEGLKISGYWADGPDYAPTGILVTVRQSRQTNQSKTPHESACFVKSPDHVCSDIYLIDDTISGIVNRADEMSDVEKDCNDGDVGAFGIAVLSYGNDEAHALQHVVIEGDTVDHTRTGQSETVTVNGDVKDFLEGDDTVYDTDNIGMDAIGWEEGTDQARDGLIASNTVANVDTYGNHSYGRWSGGTCLNLPENAAGIYDDGASYIWIDDNTVDNTDQGIDADVETPGKFTDHILVTNNTVADDPGTSLGSPSTGSNPPGVPGPSTDGGHAYEAFYVDSYGAGSMIEDVYAHGNTFSNESQYYGASKAQDAPVVDIAGRYEHIMVWDNTILGYGATDKLNPLFEIDNQPFGSAPDVFDCSDYGKLSTESSGNGNFADPTSSYLTLSSWQAHNGHGYDADSAVGVTSCPAARS
ncbi:MAG: hypothetical protein ACLQK4_16180 [Acidimicrobiales bacterium]|jgi:hypothetical protein